MKVQKLKELREVINSGQFPTDFPHFGGAELIITDHPNRSHQIADVVVLTEHAAALSWLVVQLKKIYDSKLNSMNKIDFYPYIGRLIQTSVNATDDLFETMLYVVDKIEEDWSN